MNHEIMYRNGVLCLSNLIKLKKDGILYEAVFGCAEGKKFMRDGVLYKSVDSYKEGEGVGTRSTDTVKKKRIQIFCERLVNYLRINGNNQLDGEDKLIIEKINMVSSKLMYSRDNHKISNMENFKESISDILNNSEEFGKVKELVDFTQEDRNILLIGSFFRGAVVSGATQAFVGTYIISMEAYYLFELTPANISNVAKGIIVAASFLAPIIIGGLIGMLHKAIKIARGPHLMRKSLERFKAKDESLVKLANNLNMDEYLENNCASRLLIVKQKLAEVTATLFCTKKLIEVVDLYEIAKCRRDKDSQETTIKPLNEYNPLARKYADVFRSEFEKFSSTFSKSEIKAKVRGAEQAINDFINRGNITKSELYSSLHIEDYQEWIKDLYVEKCNILGKEPKEWKENLDFEPITRDNYLARLSKRERFITIEHLA